MKEAPTGLIVFVSLGVFGEPSPKDSLFLQEHLVDAPEAAESKAADDDGQNVIVHKQGKPAEQQPGYQPHPPALPAPAVLHLDHQRMADTNAQENGGAYNDSVEIHLANNPKISMQISENAPE